MKYELYERNGPSRLIFDTKGALVPVHQRSAAAPLILDSEGKAVRIEPVSTAADLNDPITCRATEAGVGWFSVPKPDAAAALDATQLRNAASVPLHSLLEGAQKYYPLANDLSLRAFSDEARSNGVDEDLTPPEAP